MRFASINCHDLLKIYLEKLVVIRNTENCKYEFCTFSALRV